MSRVEELAAMEKALQEIADGRMIIPREEDYERLGRINAKLLAALEDLCIWMSGRPSGIHYDTVPQYHAARAAIAEAQEEQA